MPVVCASLAPFLISRHQSQERLQKSLLTCFPLFSSVYFQLLTPEAHFLMKYLTAIIYWGFTEFLLVSDPPFIASLDEYILIIILQLTFSLPKTDACKIILFLLTENDEKPHMHIELHFKPSLFKATFIYIKKITISLLSPIHLPTVNSCVYKLCIMWMLINQCSQLILQCSFILITAVGTQTLLIETKPPPHSDSYSENANPSNANMNTSFQKENKTCSMSNT
jgi:hypothetical protein